MAAKSKRKAVGQRFVLDTGPAERWQHGDVVVEVGTDKFGVKAKRVETQTVMDRYRCAKKPFINARQYEAGTRLYADWRQSGSEPRIVANYEPSIGGAEDPSDRQIRARERYAKAVQAVGKRLSPILVHVCLLDLSAGDWARKNGYRAEAGMAALHLALDSLADHYRLTPSDD